MSWLTGSSAKKIREITEDRLVIDHHPCRYVKVYVDPRQDAESMDKEAEWIKDRIISSEKIIKKIMEAVDETCFSYEDNGKIAFAQELRDLL